MFELRGNPKCPVQYFEKYLSKFNPVCQYYSNDQNRIQNIRFGTTSSAQGKNTLGADEGNTITCKKNYRKYT